MLFLCVLAWAVPSLLVQVRGPGLPLGSPPPSPEAMRVLWGWPHHLHGGAHNLSSLPISLATRHSGHLCPKSIHWGSPAELCWNYWKSNALFARRVKNSLEKWCWVWNQHNKAEQRDGGRNISEDRVGAFQSSCAQRFISGLSSSTNQYILHFASDCLSWASFASRGCATTRTLL